jgi:hypothetical protein
MIWAMLIMTFTSSGEIATAITVPYGSLSACERELQAVQQRYSHAKVGCELWPARWIGRPYVNSEALKREEETKTRAKQQEERKEARRKEEEARVKREEEAAKAKWPWRLVTRSTAPAPPGETPDYYVTFHRSKIDCEKAARQYEAAQCERR